MSSLNNTGKWSVAGVLSVWAALCLTVTTLPALEVDADTPALADLVQQAERILIVQPEKDVDVPAGQQFLVEIMRVLRGSGQKGTLARVTMPGDERTHPTFKAGQQYIFLLAKNPADKGWLYVGEAAIPYGPKGATYSANGEEQVLALTDLQNLIAANPGPEPMQERKSIEGRWVVAISQQGSDFFLWLIDVTRNKETNAYDARLTATSRLVSASTLRSSDITDERAHLKFEADGQEFDFVGQFKNGGVWGDTAVDGRMVAPTRWVASSLTNMRPYDEPKESPGREAFVKAISRDETFASLQEFVTANPTSPLALDAYRELLSQAGPQKLDQAAVEKLASTYTQTASQWGPRLELKARIDVGVALARTETLPELALKFLDEALKLTTAETPTSWKNAAQTEQAKLLIAGGQAEAGMTLLTALHAERPFEAEITQLMAAQNVKDGKVDEALELYGEIVALPMMEQLLLQSAAQSGRQLKKSDWPSQVLERLWKEKHGDTEGLEEFLKEIYEKRILSFSTEKVEPREAGNGTRVVLTELFTGAMCPPCVAADIATAGLEATYRPSEVIVLRYHQHIPGPDPLANNQTLERFQAYGGEGTPAVFLNGQMFGGAGGFLPQSPEVYGQLRELITPILSEKINLQLDLSAKRSGDRVAITARGKGLEKFPDHVRLRLVLAEDKVDFAASNGIRSHEMVVRVMPGGTDGVSPDKGQLEFKGEVDLANLKKELAEYLNALEEDLARDFEAKPLEFKGLHLVAFLQDTNTQEVLQAASIPVAVEQAEAPAE